MAYCSTLLWNEQVSHIPGISVNLDRIYLHRACTDHFPDVRFFYRIIRYRYLIGIGILSTIILFLLLSFILPKSYLSEGFFQLSDPTTEQQLLMFSVASEFLKSSKFLVFAQLKDMGLLDLQMFKDLDFKEPPSLFTLTIQEFKKYISRFENYRKKAA